jgi:hypothetical protein
MYKEVDNEDVSDNSSSDPDATVTDKYTEGETNINLWLGKEYRRGSARLQGVYGAEAGIGINSKTQKMDFGNSEENGGTGMIKNKEGMNFGISLRGFIGFEYFMMPRISIGGEYGWSFAFLSKGGGSTTTATWDGSSSGEAITENANDSELGFKNDDAAGSLVLRMYF